MGVDLFVASRSLGINDKGQQALMDRRPRQLRNPKRERTQI